MAALGPESRALRRTLFVGLGSFVVGFIAVLVAAGYLAFKYLWPEERWWAVGHFIRSIELAVLGGLVASAVAVVLLERWHCWLGVYRCPRCGRRSRMWGSPCVCRTDSISLPQSRRQRRWFRHQRKRVMPVLLTYVMLLPLAVILARASKSAWPMPLKVLFGHAMMCMLIIMVASVAGEIMKICGLARRLRLRAGAFMQVFWLWPALVLLPIVVMGILGKLS